MNASRISSWWAAVSLVVALAGCSSSGPAGKAAYQVGGSVAGLASSKSLVLQNNGGDDLVLGGDGPFGFATKMSTGAAYAVTVKAQPDGQSCEVASGTGTIGAADVTSVAVACTTPVVAAYSIGGTVTGLGASKSLVLQNAGGDDLTVNGNGPFGFATKVASGTDYAVTVKTQPAGQSCQVASGTGTVGAADVTSVAVACTTPVVPTYSIGGTLTGLPAAASIVLQDNGRDDLTLSANGTFTFATRLAGGAAYAVTVRTAPAGRTCTVTNGAGTVAAADVTGAAVSCVTTTSTALQTWSAPATWGGFWADGPTMVQHAHVDASGIVSDKGPTFTMVGGAASTPQALSGLPAPVGTRFGAGPFPDEAVSYRAASASALDLTGPLLVCAVVKPARNRPFDSFESPIIAKGVGDGKYTVGGGGWVLMQMHSSWCFHYEYKDGTGVSHQFMASVPNLFADQDFQGRMSPPLQLPPGVGPDPSYAVVCGGRSGDDIVIAANTWDRSSAAAFSLTLTQDQASPNPFVGPYTLDAATSVPATIGGYHATSAALKAAAAFPTDPAAFGGSHTFDGFVYETAVWNEEATPANVRAKMQAFLGSAPTSTYLRNREASYLDASGKLHTVARHAARLDPVKGQLFGLQSWNRVGYWIDGNADYALPMVFAAGENLDLWTRTPSSGAGAPTVAPAPAVHPPNDSPLTPGQLVTLPAGASLSIELDQALPPLAGAASPTPQAHDRRTWDASGPVQGQLWLRPVSSGTLRIQKTDPQPGHGVSCTVLGVAGTTCESKDVVLGGLAAGTWNRVSLNGSFTADATADLTGATLHPGRLVLTNAGAAPVSFHAWGVQLTQLGGGGDTGSYDPGELMYDWSASRAPGGEPSDDPWFTIDVLQLAPVTTSTASSGFCLGAEATMPSGLPWNAPFTRARTAVGWVSDPVTAAKSARLFVKGNDRTPDAGKLCFDVTGAAAPACGTIPAAWSSAGAKHTVKGCMSAAGQLRVYGDDVQLATAAAGVATPDLIGGTVLVGNSDVRPVSSLSPWHGYVSRALVCRDTGNAADCR